jgi:hypothetical protein
MAERSSKPGGNRRTDGGTRPERAPSSARPAAAGKPAPFDLWLDRGLHTLFDDIAKEPVPEALLKIIEQGRDKS